MPSISNCFGEPRNDSSDAAAEVVPAVITAVTTTIVSFLPVFFLTGRDYKLFAPLAWTKTFALAASLIVAVTVVPMLCRTFLRSSRTSRRTGLLAGLAAGMLAAVTCHLVWGERLAAWANLSPGLVTVLAGVFAFGAGWFAGRLSEAGDREIEWNRSRSIGHSAGGVPRVHRRLVGHLGMEKVLDEQLYHVDSNVVDMGLIYDVRVRDDVVEILMTRLETAHAPRLMRLSSGQISDLG